MASLFFLPVFHNLSWIYTPFCVILHASYSSFFIAMGSASILYLLYLKFETKNIGGGGGTADFKTENRV